MRVFFADRAALAFTMIFPLLFVAIFSNLMGGFIGGGDERMAVYLATHERPGSISQAIIDSLAQAQTGLQVNQLSPSEAADRMAQGALDSLAQAIAAGITSHWTEITATTQLAMQLGGPEAMARLGEILGPGMFGPGAGGSQGGNAVQPVSVTVSQVGPASPKSAANWVLPQYLTMFVFFALAMTAEGLLMERENYTLDRLVASGASSGGILLGKYLGNVVRGVMQATVLWGAGILFFGVDAGYTPWMTCAVTFALVLCASAFGLLIAAVARSRNAAGGMAVFGSLTMAPLGGCWGRCS